MVIPKTTPPVNKLKNVDRTYIIQYDPDPDSPMGEGFQWSMPSSLIYDTDVDPLSVPYRSTDHRAYLLFTNQETDVYRYRTVPYFGIMFWQAFNPLNLGKSNPITYYITDKDSSTNDPGQFNIVVNQMPYRTD